ncbi:hypothetical protein VMCG_06698 [Cytospora schulzeri]|uniref:Uncharacterized protein n=1 Tax=Cytospora schulzeri TaxID=448051 RepID=A0A423W6U2_9PEZI|nr:hypothetical protein VMCG_06698 [Valsa malicola]
MSEQDPIPEQDRILRELEQILHFPAIISPSFVFFEGNDRLTPQNLTIGRALGALTLDEVPNVVTTWPPVAMNVYKILECCVIALPELSFTDDNLAVLDFQWLGLILSHLRHKHGNSLVKDRDGSILINEGVVFFVVSKYCLDNPYMRYNFHTMNALFQEDNNHPQLRRPGIVHRFHRINKVIHSIIKLRVRLLNPLDSSLVEAIRETEQAMVFLDAPEVSTRIIGLDGNNDVAEDVSYSFVMPSQAETVPYEVFLPHRMFDDLYHQGFPSGHETYSVEEEGYITSVTHAIKRSITWQTDWEEAPDLVDLWVATHDEGLLDHEEWDQGNWENIIGRFPPSFPEAVLSLYNWGRFREQPRIVQLMLWEVGHGPGPIIQVHEEPTDYVWISCVPESEEIDWSYGAMKRLLNNAEGPNNIPQADLSEASIRVEKLLRFPGVDASLNFFRPGVSVREIVIALRAIDENNIVAEDWVPVAERVFEVEQCCLLRAKELGFEVTTNG